MENNNWYYVKNGAPNGPLNMEAMKQKINEGEVQRKTLVWNGEGDWKEACISMPCNFGETPPPISGEAVSNTFAWLTALVPLVFILQDEFYMNSIFITILAFILNTIFILIDESTLKKAGHEAPSAWWVLLVPIYLWKRAKAAKQKPVYFWVNLILIFIV